MKYEVIFMIDKVKPVCRISLSGSGKSYRLELTPKAIKHLTEFLNECVACGAADIGFDHLTTNYGLIRIENDSRE